MSGFTDASQNAENPKLADGKNHDGGRAHIKERQNTRVWNENVNRPAKAVEEAGETAIKSNEEGAVKGQQSKVLLDKNADLPTDETSKVNEKNRAKVEVSNVNVLLDEENVGEDQAADPEMNKKRNRKRKKKGKKTAPSGDANSNDSGDTLAPSTILMPSTSSNGSNHNPNDACFNLRRCKNDGGRSEFYVIAKTTIPSGTRVFTEESVMNVTKHDLTVDGIYDAFVRLPPDTKAFVEALIPFEDEELTKEGKGIQLLAEKSKKLKSKEERTEWEEKLLHTMSDRLADRQKKYDVAARFRPHSINMLGAAEDQIHVLPSDTVVVGLFPIAAHLSHSCVPNVQIHFNANINKLTVHALREIAAGEKLTTMFIGQFGWYLNKERRTEKLKRWGIGCKCEACDQSHKKFEKHEKNRTLLAAKHACCHSDLSKLSATEERHAAGQFVDIRAGQNPATKEGHQSREQLLQECEAHAAEIISLLIDEGCLDLDLIRMRSMLVDYIYPRQEVKLIQAIVQAKACLHTCKRALGDDNPETEHWKSQVARLEREKIRRGVTLTRPGGRVDWR